jgi:lectin, mannose-binding 2
VLSREDHPRDKLNTKKTIFSSTASSESGSWFGFLVKLLLFAGVCAGAYYGYMHYMRGGRGALGSFYTNGKRF